jgi:hypothetical protein
MHISEIQFYFEIYLYRSRFNILYPNQSFQDHLTSITNEPEATQAIQERLKEPFLKPSKRELAMTLLNLNYSYSHIQKRLRYSPVYIAKANKQRHQYQYHYNPSFRIEEIPNLQNFKQNWQSFLTNAKQYHYDLF